MNAYHKIRIPKRSGGYRILHAPCPDLKKKQRDLLEHLMSLRIPAGPYIHAYVKRRGIKTMGLRLKSRTGHPSFILTLDIKNFFPSLTKEVVMRRLRQECRSVWLCNEVEKFCFIKVGKREVLPQGAPTSPFLSNMVMKEVMARIGGYAKAYGGCGKRVSLRVAAYCDNIAIAGPSDGIIGLRHVIETILADYGLNLNPDKVKLIRRGQRQEVCGVIMSDKLSVRKEVWRSLRAQIFNATRDLQVGTVRPGFYLAPRAREKARARKGITRGAGLVPVSLDVKQTNAFLPIPWKTWEGKISHIRNLNPERGRQLSEALGKLKAMTEAPCKEST